MVFLCANGVLIILSLVAIVVSIFSVISILAHEFKVDTLKRCVLNDQHCSILSHHC